MNEPSTPNLALPPVLSVLPSRERITGDAAWAERFARTQARYRALGVTEAWLEVERAHSEALREDYLR